VSDTAPAEETHESTSQETATLEPTEDYPVEELYLCEENPEGDYCINVVGLSSDRQIISARHSEDAVTKVALLIGEEEYYCQVVADYPGNLYCIGPKLMNYLNVEIEIIDLDSQLILARGIVDLPGLVPDPTKPSSDYNGY
jgi:hypothetical protein